MPTKDKDDGPVAGFTQTGEVAIDKKVSEHRRKIIKASAAVVPAIMTLRSGAAVAMASSYQCFEHGADATDVDPVIGDGDGIPHDEWTRMDAKPVYCITGDNSKKYYALRKESTTYAWEDVEGWDWYHPNFANNGKIISDPADILAETNIINGWVNRIAAYCIPADPTGWYCINEYGETISTPLNPFVIPAADIEACKVIVKLLCYYDPVTGYINYYPMKNEIAGALPITESCMCSISPTFQL